MKSFQRCVAIFLSFILFTCSGGGGGGPKNNNPPQQPPPTSQPPPNQNIDSRYLDTTFGLDYNTDGTPDGYVVMHNIAGGNGEDEAYGSAIDKQGRILVTGRSVNQDLNSDMVLLRLTTDGVFDSNFGVDYNQDGTADGYIVFTHPVLSAGNEYGYAVAEDSANRIVVTGTSDQSGTWDMVVWRFTESGAPDETFGLDYNGDTNPDGYFVHDNAGGGQGTDMGLALAIDLSNQIFIAGYTDFDANPNQGHYLAAVWKITSGGVLADNFGADYDQNGKPDGYVIQRNSAGGDGHEIAKGIGLDSQSRIVVIGESANRDNIDMVVWRFSTLGVLDPGFGLDYNTDGTPDGFVYHHNAAGGGYDDRGFGLAVDAMDRILVSGYSNKSYSSSAVALWRVTSTGQLDPEFGVDYNQDLTPDGFVLYSKDGFDNSMQVVLGQNQNIYAVGQTSNDSGTPMAVWRFTPSGELDQAEPTPNGVAELPLLGATTSMEAKDMSIDPSQRLVVVGNMSVPSVYDLVIFRLKAF